MSISIYLYVLTLPQTFPYLSSLRNLVCHISGRVSFLSCNQDDYSREKLNIKLTWIWYSCTSANISRVVMSSNKCKHSSSSNVIEDRRELQRRTSGRASWRRSVFGSSSFFSPRKNFVLFVMMSMIDCRLSGLCLLFYWIRLCQWRKSFADFLSCLLKNSDWVTLSHFLLTLLLRDSQVVAEYLIGLTNSWAKITVT